ncbi:hypothetical protein GUJ93_ZPchr0009g1363 [Zizania palustris]|uniref:DUF7642 domain-containing protein n=1 Tax=Zizania palustris TaxID=103762 RepID=A0A8J5RN43_ZIZPA|nr:hypothetical protein GUJ93_ZPchr0009g1363 [Zizania palustris]
MLSLLPGRPSPYPRALAPTLHCCSHVMSTLIQRDEGKRNKKIEIRRTKRLLHALQGGWAAHSQRDGCRGALGGRLGAPFSTLPQICFPPLLEASKPFLPVADAEFRRDLAPAMGFTDEIVQVDVLERHLLAGLSPNDYTGTCEDEILYDASFGEMEDNFVKYHIARWILLSILLILAWGVGLLMLLYLPVWIYVCRRDFHSRKLCLTPHAIVYKVTKPVTFPCFGVFKDEKHVILHSVSDIVVEQGYLQSFFGLYSIRIENIGVRRPASDDIQIIGVDHPHDFRKAVLVHLSNTRSLNLGRKSYVHDDHQSISSNPITTASVPPLQDLILDKLDEVEVSVKKMQARLEGVKHPDYIMKT